MKDLAIVILAAGLGKRMNNPDLPKVMSKLMNRPLIDYVLEEAQKIGPKKIVLVVGYHKELVIDFVKNLDYDNTYFVEQKEQLGTGHAVMQAKEELADFDGNVLVLCGDVPLIRSKTLIKLITNHNNKEADVSVLSAIVKDPTGYGRIFRNWDTGEFTKIVEQKDADTNIKRIREVNSGVFVVDSKLLFSALDEVSNTNSQGEYYLTDIAEILKNKDMNVIAFPAADPSELVGVNSPEQLAEAEEFYKHMNG
jgi:UDP-N-acetylglucosamine diphosphorylase/glucosamine-1-phosphate N-acetyltransferase